MLTRLGGMAATAPRLQIELLLERALCHSVSHLVVIKDILGTFFGIIFAIIGTKEVRCLTIAV